MKIKTISTLLFLLLISSVFAQSAVNPQTQRLLLIEKYVAQKNAVIQQKISTVPASIRTTAITNRAGMKATKVKGLQNAIARLQLNVQVTQKLGRKAPPGLAKALSRLQTKAGSSGKSGSGGGARVSTSGVKGK